MSKERKCGSAPQVNYLSYGNTLNVYFQDKKWVSTFHFQDTFSLLHKKTAASSVDSDNALSTRVSQRSQTRSKDLKNKENPVTENILLHSSFESLLLKVLRTNYFQYELAPGEWIKGAFLFQLVMKRALQKTLVTWMAVLRFPETQWAFLIRGTKRQRCVTDLNECGSWVDRTHSSAL